MMNDWIDIRKQLPPDKTWVEAKYIPIAGWVLIEEYFYFSKYPAFKDITHWRPITHEFFNPIQEKSVVKDLSDVQS